MNQKRKIVRSVLLNKTTCWQITGIDSEDLNLSPPNETAATPSMNSGSRTQKNNSRIISACVIAQVGETRSISCLAEGNPEPQFEWLQKLEEKVREVLQRGRFWVTLRNPSKWVALEHIGMNDND